MPLTRATLLKRVSLGALALALGKLPSLEQAGPVTLEEMTGVPTLRSAGGAAWLPLDGRTLTRHDYPELHAALRNVYGVASGSEADFVVPDFRGRALLSAQARPVPEGPSAQVVAMMRTGGENAGMIAYRASGPGQDDLMWSDGERLLP